MGVLVVTCDDIMVEWSKATPFLNSRIPYSLNFLQHNSPTPQCRPDRHVFLTGQYPWNNGQLSNAGGAAPNMDNWLPVWLQAAGYRTAFKGKPPNGYGTNWYTDGRVLPGWDEWFALMSSGYYRNFWMSNNGVPTEYPSPAYTTKVFGDSAVDWILNQPDDNWFMWLCLTAPHEPYSPADEYKTLEFSPWPDDAPSLCESDTSDKPPYIQTLSCTVSNHRTNLKNALRCMATVDDELEDIWAAAGSQTYKIFTGDNGFSHGRNRWRRKTAPYPQCFRTPLIFDQEGITPGSINRLTNTADLTATICELAGAIPGMVPSGESLIPFFDGSLPCNWRTEQLLGWRGSDTDTTAPLWWGLRTLDDSYDDMYTIYDKDNFVEYYDYSTDPDCLTNDPLNDVTIQRATRLQSLIPGGS